MYDAVHHTFRDNDGDFDSNTAVSAPYSDDDHDDELYRTAPLSKTLHITIDSHSTTLPSPSPSPSSPTTNSAHLPIDDTTRTPSPRTPRVHFRSRVRIASGIHRSRSRSHPGHSPTLSPSSSRKTLPRLSGGDGDGGISASPAPSPTSSRSSSRSSSISVPLRPPDSDAKSANPLWGPLGQRVRLFAWRRVHTRPGDRSLPTRDWDWSWSQEQEPDSEHHRPRKGFTTGGAGERSPLIKTVLRPSTYGTHIHRQGGWRADLFSSDNDNEEGDGELADEARLDREVDLFFGKWPGRLLNYHWWWWQLEPFVCFLCKDV